MQITQNSIGLSSETQPAAKAPGTSSGSPARAGQAARGRGEVEDTATLSTAASLLSRALAGDVAQPEKVARISAALANGTYTIDSHRVASSLIESMQQHVD